jgi:hypothetical protein
LKSERGETEMEAESGKRMGYGCGELDDRFTARVVNLVIETD